MARGYDLTWLFCDHCFEKLCPSETEFKFYFTNCGHRYCKKSVKALLGIKQNFHSTYLYFEAPNKVQLAHHRVFTDQFSFVYDFYGLSDDSLK